MNSNELSEARLLRYESVLRREYENTSIITDAVRTRWYDSVTDADKKFEKFSIRLKTEDAWYTDLSMDADLVFSELARTITLYEEKYLISRIISDSHFTSTLPQEEEFEGLLDVLDRFRVRGYRPNVLFLPVEIYASFNVWALNRGLNLDFGEKRDVLQVDPLTKLTLMWSNKFVPFEGVIIVDPVFGEWIYKKDERTGSTLRLKVEPGKEALIETEFHFTMVDPEAIVRVPLPAKEGPTEDARIFLARFLSIEEEVGKVLSLRKVAPQTSDPATLARRLEQVDSELGEQLRWLIDIRNRVVHQSSTVGSKELTLAIRSAEDFSSGLRRLISHEAGT